MQAEVLVSVFKLYSAPEHKDLHDAAISILGKEYLVQTDPNLKSVGMSILKEHVGEGTIRTVFGATMMQMVKEEKDQGMQARILAVITKVVDCKNYEWVINCVFS